MKCGQMILKVHDAWWLSFRRRHLFRVFRCSRNYVGERDFIQCLIFFFDNSASSLDSAESATCRLFNGTIFRCGMKGNGAFDFRLQFHLFVSFSFVFSSFGKLSCGRPRLDHRQQSIGVIDKQKNREFEMEKGRTRSTKRSLHACCLFFSVECIALGRGANSLDGLYICKFCVVLFCLFFSVSSIFGLSSHFACQLN